jgi:TIR domain
MFNLLITARENHWESSERMDMMLDRFGEYSGDARMSIHLDKPDSLTALERVKTLLMYETGRIGSVHEVVRVGRVLSLKVGEENLSFRFREEGKLTRQHILENRKRLQFGKWEDSRTHWAVKDGDIPQDILRPLVLSELQYDIVISFAGAQREYAVSVVRELERNDVAVFYDENESATLWGRNLVEHFNHVYRKAGRYCVMLVSAEYRDSIWTTHESRAAFSRAMEQEGEYVLPVRFDKTELPGLLPTVQYVEAANYDPVRLAQHILKKLGRFA